MAAMATPLGSAPAMAAWAQRPRAWRSQAKSKVARSSPARPGMMRRAGMTIQFVVASRNSPIGFLNGTRSHWKWKRASKRNTRNETIVSIRKVAICPNMSVLRELVAELAAAAGGGRERLREPLRQLLLLEDLQRGLGS